jgi:translation initiation factor IF-2
VKQLRRVFDIKGLGVIAGCYVKDGRITKDSTVVVWRGNQKIGEGSIKTLQRDKKAVKEVHSGYECAFMIDGVSDFQVDDRIECFVQVAEKPKK